jgi:phosphatidylinositol alpha-mannosyltransferase
VIPIGRSVIAPANGSLSNIILTPQSMFRIERAFDRERFDVLHVHEPFAPIVSTFAVARANAPVVSTSHSSGDSMRWYPVANAFFGFLRDRIDYKLAVSERARETARRFLGDPIEILSNGVVIPPEADPAGRRPHVVFIGRNEPRKGLPVLLRAWPEVAAATDARLRVVGADPLSVKWLMRRQGFESRNVDLLGSIPEGPLTEELLQASLLVAPSVGRESFGMVLTRAFGCATPVVASDIEGYREVANAENGLLVPPGDPDALAAALIELLSDEPRRVQLGTAARTLAEERYAWSRIAGRLVEIYTGLVETPAAETVAA